METIAFLEKIIGGHRTLVITCMECCLDIEQRIEGEVFRYTALGNVLNPRDKYQRQSILSFVEFKGCTRIVIAGHHNCRALKYILSTNSDDLRFTGIRQDMVELLNTNHQHLMKDPFKDHFLVEQNVIKQCETLLNYLPIRTRFELNQLSVIGMVIESSGMCRQIYFNGLSYNNLLASN